MPTSLPLLHLGPVMPGWGSWEWLGEDMIPEFQKYFEVHTFTFDAPPPSDGAVVVIKHVPPQAWAQALQRTASIYCPVDYYGSLNDIDRDAAWLSQVDHIIVHCHRHLPYFMPYAPTTYLNHQLRFVPERMVDCENGEYILWVGVHSNLPPLIEWLYTHTLPLPLLVLTNLPEGTNASEVGFPVHQDVRIKTWSPEVHMQSLEWARAAIDVKGKDFRSRHKPPTKALDYLASGLPVALNPQDSPGEYLATRGFTVASLEDPDIWLSSEYLLRCQQLGIKLRKECHRSELAKQWKDIVSLHFIRHSDRTVDYGDVR